MNTDSIVAARIHPAIGVARIGNSLQDTGYFIGPEIPHPCGPPPGGYRDSFGALKRQAARFRIYGYDVNGKVVAELTSSDAEVAWTVHVANKKSSWYQYGMALDLKPEASSVQSARRNSMLQYGDRSKLEIDPGPRSISGANQAPKAFDTGTFFDVPVYLGEIRTDEAGRLLFLGGRGHAGSPFPGYTLVTWCNNPGWYDDISDGPVEATVKIGSRNIPVDGAWVVTAPPNYAPDILGVVTMYDLIYDALAGTVIQAPANPSFTRDILPIFRRLAGLQWVNAGYLSQFGWRAPYDFHRPDFLAMLAAPGDEFQELRRQIQYMFRQPGAATFQAWQWPPLYGDAVGLTNNGAESPLNGMAITYTQYQFLTQWMNGQFEADYDPQQQPITSFDDVPLNEQPEALDRAALTFCLGGPFHPGCEMTWPMRIQSMYRGRFRLRKHPPNFNYPDYGDFLNQNTVLAPSGPLSASGPGDITRWMSVPWQADAASCRQGYAFFENSSLFNTDPYLPSFWPARVPNEVLSEADYQIVANQSLPLEQRVAAFFRRVEWPRLLGDQSTPYVDEITKMVTFFDKLGIVEKRQGVKGDPNFPPEMYVESLPPAQPFVGPQPPSGTARTVMNLRFGGNRRT
jgi:hypothetical protein